MNAAELAKRAYAPTAAPVKSERSVEFEVIARITARLKAAIESDQFPKIVEALHENRKLWRTLAINVADCENGLPEELRARLFYLAEFTSHHTGKVLTRNATAIPLLEVNTAILRGLKGGRAEQ